MSNTPSVVGGYGDARCHTKVATGEPRLRLGQGFVS